MAPSSTSASNRLPASRSCVNGKAFTHLGRSAEAQAKSSLEHTHLEALKMLQRLDGSCRTETPQREIESIIVVMTSRECAPDEMHEDVISAFEAAHPPKQRIRAMQQNCLAKNSPNCLAVSATYWGAAVSKRNLQGLRRMWDSCFGHRAILLPNGKPHCCETR